MPMYGSGFSGPKFEIKEKPMTLKEQLRLSTDYARIDAALSELEKVKASTTDETVARSARLSIQHLKAARTHIQSLDEAIKRPRVR